MGSSSVFTHCVLNYAISMNNLPCSKWVGIMGMIYNQKDTGDDLKGQCKAEQTWCTTTVLFQTAIIVSAMHLTFTINYYRIP